MKDRVLEVLMRTMSRLHAEMTLRRAIGKAKADADLDDLSTYPQLAAALETSLHVLTRESEALVVVRELRALLTPDPPPAITLELRTEADMSVARQAARNLAEKMGARSFAAQKFTTAVSELVRNIVQYAGEGVVELSPLSEGRRGVRVHAIDTGPGISNLEEILEGKYKSKTGLGKGILGARQLMDRFEISSGSGGTRVEAELDL